MGTTSQPNLILRPPGGFRAPRARRARGPRARGHGPGARARGPGPWAPAQRQPGAEGGVSVLAGQLVPRQFAAHNLAGRVGVAEECVRPSQQR